MAGGDFTPVLEIVVFCLALFVGGVLCKRIGFSPIIGEMVIGCALGPNGANIVPYEQFFRLAGVFGVTLMIFESGLHVDFAMLQKVGLRASVVAVLGTFLPLLSGMFLIIAFDPERYSVWPAGLACGVTLAPTSVGMALKMLGEKKQLGEEYGQLIVTAAFVDDILSLVALTMLLQIGIAESTGAELSIWRVLQPLVFSVLFCVGGALMAMPIKRTKDDGPIKAYLLRFVGIFPEFVPGLMVFWGHRGHEHHHYAQDLQEEQDQILVEYGDILEEAAGHIMAAIRSDPRNKPAFRSERSDDALSPRSAGVPESKLAAVHDFIQRDIEHAQKVFHQIAEERASKEHHSTVLETDMEQAIIHGKADLFEGFLRHTADLIEDLNPSISSMLKRMAQAHNIIHETKEGEHREQWEQDIEANVTEHMNLWRELHSHAEGGGHGDAEHAHLKEFKEESEFRTKVVLDAAMTQVRAAFVALKQCSAGDDEAELARIQLMENILSSKAEDRKQAGLLKLKLALEMAHEELDVIEALSMIRSDIWDDWMSEVIIDMASHHISPAVTKAVEELQYLQTHLFANKEEDILGQKVSFASRPLTPRSSGESETEDDMDGEDALSITRMKWRANLVIEHEKENRFILTMMFLLLIAYGVVANAIGSHLLGAFIAGMSFCWMQPAMMLWHSQVKRIANWLIRLFFGCTVAFSIPIKIMMNVEALWKGALLGAGPCCLTKIIAGITTGGDKWVVGFAMVGRGEFAYLVAQTAQATLLNPAPDGFAAPPTNMVKMPGGYWCVDGDCGNGTHAHRRGLGGSGTCDSAASSTLWCNHCPGGVCDDTAVAGHKYWQAGQACAEFEDACDCEMMMPASAFSICVWALVMASILAPTGFGIVLKRKMAAEKEEKLALARETRKSFRSLSLSMGSIKTSDASSFHEDDDPITDATGTLTRISETSDATGGDDNPISDGNGTLTRTSTGTLTRIKSAEVEQVLDEWQVQPGAGAAP